MDSLAKDIRDEIFSYLQIEPCSICRDSIYIDRNSCIKSNLEVSFVLIV